MRRIPTYNLSTAIYARAIGAALVVGPIAGVVWWLFNTLTFQLGIFAVALFGIGIGFAVGEAVALATNRRAGPPLQIIAVAGVIVAYLVRTACLISFDGWTLSTLRVVDGVALLALVAAAWIASQRVR